MRTPSNDDEYLISSATYQLERYDTTEDSGHSLSWEDSVNQPHASRLFVSPWKSPLPVVTTNCWLSLFHSCVVVESFLAPYNGVAKGLETSFDSTIALAAAKFCLKINGILVFFGYQTLLYPVITDGNCAQFHLIAVPDGQINPYNLDPKNAFPTDDSIQFKIMRCFDRWCEVAHTNLGIGELTANVDTPVAGTSLNCWNQRDMPFLANLEHLPLFRLLWGYRKIPGTVAIALHGISLTLKKYGKDRTREVCATSLMSLI